MITRILQFLDKPSFSRIRRNIFFWIALVVCLLSAGGLIYYKTVHQPAQAASQASAIQTATVRQGDLVISATGTGTLTATEEVELAFTAGGEVIRIPVKSGDEVEAGQLLAEVDSRAARTGHSEARQRYRELTSPAAVAAAQKAVAQAEVDLTRTLYQLEYLISPDVLYWELKIETTEQELEGARAAAQASPADQNAQQHAADLAAYIDVAQDMLGEAWKTYYDEYVPETFGILIDADKDIYAVPSDLEITAARTAIDDARTALAESRDLYSVLTGSAMPGNASSDALIELQKAERGLQEAQNILDGSRIIAPIAGTIMEVNASVGETVGTDTMIVLADLSQPRLEIYLDESDWDKAAVGSEVEVTFDALPDQVFTGTVTEVDTELYSSFNTTAVRAEVALDGTFAELDLPLGAGASVEVISQRVEGALLVPVEALHETGPGQYAVYVVEDGQPVLRAVEIGVQDQIYAEVKSGLQPGEVVVTGGTESE
jgi:HlyD family secretion protein